MAGYASIYWLDGNADGRQDSSEVCRVSGKVDAVTGIVRTFEVRNRANLAR